MKPNYLNITVALLVALVAYFVFFTQWGSDSSLGASNCAVTTSKVAIGDDSAVTVLAAGIKEWAIIQQPLNATNTVSLSIGGTAVSGSGYRLASGTISDAAQEFVLGNRTSLPTSDAVSAITDTGSTSINVIVCK